MAVQDETEYSTLLANQELRTAFVDYAELHGLSLAVYGPNRAWANMRTTLHFSAFAHAWLNQLPDVPNPVQFAMRSVARRWYEGNVMPMAAQRELILPNWVKLPEPQKQKIVEEYQAMQREMNDLFEGEPDMPD